MSLSDGFIKRPVLTTVCSVVIILVGAICLAVLPLDKLPQIAPQQIVVTANYVGADAKTTVDNVTTPIERQIVGVDDMRWMFSNTDNTGNTAINITFPTEIDSNIAQVLVQNRVAQANAFLPQSVIATGVNVQKQSPSITLVYGFYSEKNANGQPIYDTKFINNYVDRQIWNELRRITGVGSLSLFGSDLYAMRIWLDPDKLAARGLTATDVVRTIQQQNFEVGVGAIGQQPAPPDQQFQITLRAAGRFKNPEEAGNLVVKVEENGTLIRLNDVGRTELGLQNYTTLGLLDGDNPAVALVVYQLPGSNALDTANAIKAKMQELEPSFPPGLKYAIAQDNTLFVTASIDDLVKTLTEAIGLVILIIFIFLQDWRVTIIPAIAIPVSLIGTFAAMQAFGFSLNQLTLFALVLATGLVVDDGIIIVEAVSNKLAQGMRPMQAALDSMEELFGAVIATTLVLLAVFVPVSFFPGTTGIVYKQFAITIAASIIVSTFNAISFSPTMSAILLRPPRQPQGPLGWFFRKFDQFFNWFKGGYGTFIEFLTRIKIIIMALFIGGLVLTVWLAQSLPQGFIPEEDQGYFFMLIEAPASSSLTNTHEISRQVMQEVIKYEEVEHAMALTGFSFDGRNNNKGFFFVKLHPWRERRGAEHSVFSVTRRLNQAFAQNIGGGQVIAVNAPPVDGLSSFSGLEMYVEDRQSRGMDALIDNAKRVMQAASERPEVGRAFTTATFNAPLMEITLDRNKANAQNVDINEILLTLQTYLGANFVNQFVLDGRLYRVLAQAEGDLRSNPQDISRLYVRSRDGAMITLSNFISTNSTTYPPIVTNYNTYPAIKINIAPTTGFSTGQVIQVMEEAATQALQPGFGFSWTNTAFEEKVSGGAAPIVFGLGLVMVFLVLAAQYESYIDPLIIIITVPLAILGALGAIWLRATFLQGSTSIWPILNNNIYVQVGMVMLIGMASKNAILVVEFANQARDLGMSITKAATYAAEERLRPILMTSVSGLVGFLPLLTASGAGAVSRWSLGTAIFGGLLLSTVLSLIVVPNLYIVIKSFEEHFLKGGGKPPQPKQPIQTSPQKAQPRNEEVTTPYQVSPPKE